MPKVTVIQRPGRKKPYFVWHEPQPDGTRRQVWRAAPTDNLQRAEELAIELSHAREGQIAEERVMELLRQMRADVPAVATTPIAELWAAYLKQPTPREITPRSLRSKRLLVEAWMAWMTAHHPELKGLRDVSPRIAAEYLGELRQQVAGQTYNNTLSALRSVFQVMLVPAGLDRNPFAAVPRIQARTIRKRHLTLDQIRALLTAADTTASSAPGWWRPAILLAYYTGLRLRTICTLEAANLIPAEHALLIRPEQHKNGRKSLLFPLPPEVWDALPQPSEDYLWPKVAKSYHATSGWLSAEFNELLKAIHLEPTRAPGQGERRKRDVKQYGFHSLRHAFVTAALDAGVSLGDVQLTAGHGSPVMTQHYSHSLAAARRVMSKLPRLGTAASPATTS